MPKPTKRQLRQGHHGQRRDGDGRHALQKDIVQLRMIRGPEMEADDGTHTHGEAQKNGGEGEVHIHHHRVGSHPGFSDDAHELQVEQDTYH